MKTRNHITLKSQRFNLTEQKDNFINEGNFGEDIAIWLHSKAKENTILSAREPDQEDWGWYVPLTYKDMSFIINLGAYPGEHYDWLLWVEAPKVGFINKLKKINYDSESNIVHQLVNDILVSEDSVSEIRWYYEKDFKVGNEDDWKKSPSDA